MSELQTALDLFRDGTLFFERAGQQYDEGDTRGAIANIRHGLDRVGKAYATLVNGDSPPVVTRRARAICAESLNFWQDKLAELTAEIGEE